MLRIVGKGTPANRAGSGRAVKPTRILQTETRIHSCHSPGRRPGADRSNANEWQRLSTTRQKNLSAFSTLDTCINSSTAWRSGACPTPETSPASSAACTLFVPRIALSSTQRERRPHVSLWKIQGIPFPHQPRWPGLNLEQSLSHHADQLVVGFPDPFP
jgi:hypothetical protein